MLSIASQMQQSIDDQKRFLYDVSKVRIVVDATLFQAAANKVR